MRILYQIILKKSIIFFDNFNIKKDIKKLIKSPSKFNSKAIFSSYIITNSTRMYTYETQINAIKKIIVNVNESYSSPLSLIDKMIDYDACNKISLFFSRNEDPQPQQLALILSIIEKLFSRRIIAQSGFTGINIILKSLYKHPKILCLTT